MSNIDGMKLMDEDCVDLVVTSPPYDNLREYNESSFWNWDTFTQVADRLIRVLKPGGIICWNVADAIVQAIITKDNEGKIYEIGGPKIISFGDMVKSILNTIGKKRLILDLPMPLAKIQAALFTLMPKPLITKDQCEILNEAATIVLFPHSGQTYQIERVLKLYCGLSSKQIQKCLRIRLIYIVNLLVELLREISL